ncbi:MAG TPA: glycoside hydrolase family 13 protein [Anaerolineales bacterium]|nr:glycoside hydrolase family 13 protein [Anaerolineales bacterium]
MAASKANPQQPTNDFVFGTLATDELRTNLVRTRRAGVTHLQARRPRDPLPGQPIELELTVGPAYPLEQAWVYWTNDGCDPAGSLGQAQGGQATPMQVTGVEWDTQVWGYVRHFRATLPGQADGTVLRYRISAAWGSQAEMWADGGAFYACYIADDPTPAWTRQAVVYQIFVDRFFPGQGSDWKQPDGPAGFYGGTLRGITEKLDHISELGANVLWLTPVFPSPSHHGYDATDYFEIEPRLGSKQDLQQLLAAAHSRGMRVLLDFVPNHWSWGHPSFQEAIRDSKSPYHHWYTFTHWPDQYETFFGVRDLPQINLRHAPARQHLLDAAAYWLKLGVDGYRVDYAVGPAPDFWAEFRRATRQACPDSWTFGEVVEPPDSQLNFEGGLDGCLDFGLLEAFRQGFAFGNWNAGQVGAFLARHMAYFPETFSRPSFLDNHDMNRFLWAARGDERRLRLAALCQFTLPGAPVIYYGTEVGLSQVRDVRQDGRGLPEESRLPMLWGEAQNIALLDFYKDLVAFRRRHVTLGEGSFEAMPVQDDVLAYRRGELVVVLNLSQEKRSLTLPGGQGRLLFASQPGLGAPDLEHRLDLPPLSGVVIG